MLTNIGHKTDGFLLQMAVRSPLYQVPGQPRTFFACPHANIKRAGNVSNHLRVDQLTRLPLRSAANLFFQADVVLDASVSRDYKRAGRLFGGSARGVSPNAVVAQVPPLTGLLDLEVYATSIFTMLWSVAMN